jgi:hypothetical protein
MPKIDLKGGAAFSPPAPFSPPVTLDPAPAAPAGGKIEEVVDMSLG